MKHLRTRVVGLLGVIAAVSLGATIVASADSATMTPETGTAAVNGSGLRDAALDTAFNLELAAGAHCTNNADNGYRVRSYFIGSGVTLSSVDFGLLGLPLPASGTGSGTTFVSTLPNVSGAAFTLNPGSSSPFLVTGVPQLSLYRMVNKATIPAGTYHMGIACVNPSNVVDGSNFWDVAITISGQSASSLTWALVPTGPPPSTTTTTTSSTTTTTTTIPGGSTTTTTTTTVGRSTTTSTSTSSSTSTSTSTTAAIAGGPENTTMFLPTAEVIVDGGAGTLAHTGSSTWSLLVVTILTLIVGRMVLLIARPVRELPPRSR